MKTPSFKKVCSGEMQGWLREDILLFLPPSFFEDPIRFITIKGGKIIRESRWRQSAIFPLSNGRSLFLKMDRTKGWTEFLKYLLLPSRGRKEWFIAYQLGKRNLNVPKPIGWMERSHRCWVRESYYLSEAIESGVPLIEIADLLKDETIFAELVKTLIRIHASGLFHQDLHAGNFLWDGESFFPVDLHRARLLRTLTLNQRLWNLSHLFHSLRSIWEEKDRVRFLRAYFSGDSVFHEKQEECLRRVHSWMERLQRRQWRSRTRRCLKESTEFSVKKKKGTIAYHRKEFPFDRLERVIGKHLILLKEDSFELKKKTPEIIVSLFEDGGDKVCVKQFCCPTFGDRLKEAFRLSKGLKAWLGGNGLRVRGVSSVKPLALMEQRRWLGNAESFLIMEASDTEEEMDRYLCKRFDGIRKKRNFIKAFSLWVGQLHQRYIYHLDMKACNVLVSENWQDWDFKLLDLEDIRLNEKVDEKKLFKNMLQLNTSIPRVVTRTDRLRFFRTYLGRHPIIKNEKEFLFRLIKKSRERGIVYVSPYGVVKERTR